MRRHSVVLVGLAVLSWIPLVHADDGAASIAQGGIVVMTKEPRITMAKELLRISDSKVVVDYDFRNDTDQDVVTVVAFPIPSYGFAIEQVDPNKQGFDDFRLWVDNKPATSKTEARGYIKGKDLTTVLNSMHVDVGSLGTRTQIIRFPMSCVYRATNGED